MTVLGAAISIVALWLVLRSVDLPTALAVISSAAPLPLVLALALALLGLALRILIWRLLLPPRADGSTVPFRRVAPVVLVGLLGNVLLPARLGEVLRAYVIRRREEIRVSGALASILLERIIDVAALAVLGFAAAAGAGIDPWIVQGLGALAVVGSLVVALLALTGLNPIVRRLPALARIPVLRPGVAAIHDRLESFARWSGGPHRRRVISIAAVLAATAWCVTAMAFLLVAQAVDARLAPGEAVLVMAVIVLATAIPSAPAYVGTFELAAVAVTTSLGVPVETALAFAVLAHVVTLLPTVVGGPMALAYIGIGLRRLTRVAILEQKAGEE